MKAINTTESTSVGMVELFYDWSTCWEYVLVTVQRLRLGSYRSTVFLLLTPAAGNWKAEVIATYSMEYCADLLPEEQPIYNNNTTSSSSSSSTL
jgi:hypothetical protein